MKQIKTFFAFALVLLPCASFTQHVVKYIKNDIEQITYDETLRQPLQVQYQVLCDNGAKEHYSREGMDFYEEPNYVTSTNEDYKHNEYDKGHMLPAMDVTCNQDYLKRSFSFLNCALQHQDLNRGVWEHLEKHEKYLAMKNPVFVKINVLFDTLVRVRPYSKNSAYLPTAFRKTICVGDTLASHCKTYLFPNQKPQSNNFEDYITK